MKIIIILLIIITAIVAYHKFSYPNYTYRYRMTVEVDTPEGVKSGSSVIEVHTTQWPYWLRHLAGGHTENSRSIGEAVVVDLGNRGMLFTAFRDSYSERIYPLIYTGQGYGSRQSGGVPEYATATDFKASIPEKHYPLLVNFRNIKDPKTIEIIDSKDLSIIFGRGVSLKTIIIETTSSPLEFKLKEILPSFGEKTGYTDWYHSLPFGDLRQLDKSAFIKSNENHK